MVRLKKPKVIICDIEGTTTSTKYWGECLVPFIKYNASKCLREKWGNRVLMKLIDNLRKATKEANEGGEELPVIAQQSKNKDAIIQSVVDNVIHQMNNQRYGRALQNLQIYIWKYGYETKQISGHVFPDVSKAFDNWHKSEKIKIYTYSSGIYLTQKLLFACSNKGNLTPLIKDFFDVESYGSKEEVKSYKKISKVIGVNLSDILFLSDNPKELSAAKSAGCEAIGVRRPQNKPISGTDFEVIKSFDEISFK